MSLISPPLDHEGLPQRGVTSLGIPCECDCHRMAGVYHIMACCQPRLRGVVNGFVSDDDPFPQFIGEVQPEDLIPGTKVISDLKIQDHVTHADGSGSFRMTGIIATTKTKPVVVLTELQVDVNGKPFATLTPEPADWDKIEDASRLMVTVTRSDGSKVYPWLCGSPSKHMNCWLGYDTEDEALAHKRAMDVMLESYDEPESRWNKEFWPKKPAPWVVFNNVKLLVRES